MTASFSLRQHEKILKFISTAKSEGATVLCGGDRPEVQCSSLSLLVLS